MPRHEALNDNDMLKMSEYLLENGAFDEDKMLQEPVIKNIQEEEKIVDNDKLDQQRLSATIETITWYKTKRTTSILFIL